MKRVPVSVHVKNLRQMRCCVSDTDQDIEIHHAHSGSMVSVAMRGMSAKTNPFFQIPLTFKYHRGEFDPESIGIKTWETKFGKQLDMLERVNEQLPYDIWVQAGLYDGDRMGRTILEPQT